MFLSDQRMLALSIAAARVRLANLVDDGQLTGTSERAYQEGLDHRRWAGPIGNSSRPSRLVRVQIVDRVERADSVTMGIRWEAIGIMGLLFPALDANITLTPEGDQYTRLTLRGVYRPPFGPLGAGLDQVLLHNVATSTIHSLLTRLSRALEDTAPGPGEA